jgi:hypothetical protein
LCFLLYACTVWHNYHNKNRLKRKLMMDMKNELIEIAQNFVLEGNEAVVLREPYIPYIPENWNRVLVLAESQNLSERNKNYVKKLRAISTEERILRLYQGENRIGVQPWDDGTLKIAIEAIGFNESETGVSNAVPWSLITESGANRNPDKMQIDQSVEIWKAFASELNPELVVAAGKIAQNVVERALGETHKNMIFKVRLPSKQAISRVSGMFNEADLVERYPEVKKVIEAHPEWLLDYRQNKIFFACHAVSIFSKRQ